MDPSDIKYMDDTKSVVITSINTASSEAEQQLIESVKRNFTLQPKTRVTKSQCQIWKRAFREYNVDPQNKHAYMSDLLDYLKVLHFHVKKQQLSQ